MELKTIIENYVKSARNVYTLSLKEVGMSCSTVSHCGFFDNNLEHTKWVSPIDGAEYKINFDHINSFAAAGIGNQESYNKWTCESKAFEYE